MSTKGKDKLIKQILKASDNFYVDGSHIKATYVEGSTIRMVFSGGKVFDISITQVEEEQE